VTWSDLFQALAADLTNAGPKPFTHAVVDEAQDLSVAELRFLPALAGDCPDGLFFAGDLGQRIFRQPFSWKALGVDVRGRSRTLRVNYRTSHQIRSRAEILLPTAIADVDGNEEGRRGIVSVFNGPDPLIEVFDGPDPEIERVADWLLGLGTEGVGPGEIGLITRTVEELPRAREAVELAGLQHQQLSGSVDILPNRVSLHHALGQGAGVPRGRGHGLRRRGNPVGQPDREHLG
jgi:superfamily I DNA/RNA helicase